MTETHLISTPTTGRYLVDSAARPGAPLLVGFHGYGQQAEELLEELRRIPGAEGWTRVAVQALHRFYSPKTRQVVGSWMTSLDRERAIADNLAYVRAVLTALGGDPGRVVFLGFSQGAAMAWRAAQDNPCQGVIVLGGDLPGDVAESHLDLPPALLGRGDEDPFYPAAQLDQDVAVLEARGLAVEVIRFPGGHEWGPAFLTAAGEFLARVAI